MQPITSTYYDWTHGTKGLLIAYVLTAVFSLIGLQRGHAGTRQFLYWPATSLITLVVVAITISVLNGILQSASGAETGGVPGALFDVLLIMAGGFGGGMYWAKGPRFKAAHARGAVVVEGTESRRQVRGLESQARGRAEEPLSLAGIPVPFEDETKHFKLIGTTGTGKSTAMRELLDGALKRGDRAVIADPDGGYLSRFYNPKRGDVILNPFDARSAKWDLFAELKQPYDIEMMARALIPDRPKADPTWTSYGRTLFTAVVGQVQASTMQSNQTKMQELTRLLTRAKWEELRILLEGTLAANYLAEPNAKMFGSILGTLVDHLQCLKYVCAQDGNLFSVRDWIKSERGVLFIPYQADQIPALRPIISVWMRLAIVQTLSLPEGDWRLWFSVDELDALGPIDGLSDALPRLRKFGGRCALGFQAISQVGNTYGDGLAQAMVENCGTTLALRCSASDNGGTSGFVSRLIGQREIVRKVKSSGRSQHGVFGTVTSTHGTSEQHATEYAVMPAEIEQLQDRNGFLKFPSQPAWMRVTFPYYDPPKVAEAFLPAS